MKLLINTASSFKGGGIQVAKSYLEEFKKIQEHEYFVVLSENLSNSINKEKFPSNFQFLTAPFRPATKFFCFRSHNYFLKDIEKSFKPDIVFSTGGPSYWRPRSIHIIGFTLGHYIYPESPYFNIIPFKNRLRWMAMKGLAQYLFKRDADVIVTQTDDVNKRVRKFLKKERVYTISNTIASSYSNPDLELSKKLPIRKRNEFRLFSLSAWYPHKNLSIIPEVVEILRKKDCSNIKFIITLPEVDYHKLSNYDNIINVGPVPIETGPSYYRECDAMFLPTLLECFSASYAEAMIMKKPIITSDMGFAHTVCKDAALYFDPMNAEDIADKIILLYESKELQNELIEKGLIRLSVFGTAEERAKRVLEICNNLIYEQKNS